MILAKQRVVDPVMIVAIVSLGHLDITCVGMVVGCTAKGRHNATSKRQVKLMTNDHSNIASLQEPRTEN